jgi:gluconate kinase
MKVDLLASQLDTLEEPPDALVVDVSSPPNEIVKYILSQVRRPGALPASKSARSQERE